MISAAQVIYASRMKERILYHACKASISCGDSRISHRASDISYNTVTVWGFKITIESHNISFPSSIYNKEQSESVLRKRRIRTIFLDLNHAVRLSFGANCMKAVYAPRRMLPINTATEAQNAAIAHALTQSRGAAGKWPERISLPICAAL